MLSVTEQRPFLFYLAGKSIFTLLNSTVTYFSLACQARSTNTEIRTTWLLVELSNNMTEEIIDREQLLAAFNELGVEEVDEAVSFDI